MADVDTELAAKRDELAKAMRDIALARETSETLMSHAKAVKEQAEKDAAAIIQEAQALAQHALANVGIR